MKSVVVVAAILLSTAGCQNARVTSLEQRVNHLEQSIRELEAERTKNAADDAARQKKLETCVAVANFDFETNMANNGTKDGKGGYNVPVPVMTEMRRQKQSNLEECSLLYSH